MKEIDGSNWLYNPWKLIWKQYFDGYTMSQIDMISLRSFHHVREYAKKLIGEET